MIYLDNSATTKPSQNAIKAFLEVAEKSYGNPSSVHARGAEAALILKKARMAVAKKMHTEPGNIIFTGGGTMADNLAVQGAVSIKRGGTVVTTAIEHPAVKNVCLALEKKGICVKYVNPDKNGIVCEEAISEALTEDTVLVSVMHVNNETGAIMPVEKLKARMQAVCPKALLHTDCVQSFGKLPVLPESWGADLVSVSAHKIHGIRGAGALYVRKGVTLSPVIYGGGQERDICPGTENLPAIAAMAAACEETRDMEKVQMLSEKLLCGIREIEYAEINSPEGRLSNIINVSFGEVPAEVVTNALSNAGICVSGGSACAGARSEKSYVLRAMGASHPDSGVRFSLSDENTEEEIEETIRVLKSTIPMLYMALGVRRR